MKTLHCDIWDNNVTSFCDDIDAADNDEGIIFAFADHDDIESWECEDSESATVLILH